jgi:hypothetical protein
MLTVAGRPGTTEGVLQKQEQSIQHCLADKTNPGCFRGVEATRGQASST